MNIEIIAPANPEIRLSKAAASASLGLFASRGERGPQGAQGVQGIQGPKGDTDLAAINAHIDDSTPHPTYDDIPSLTLLFENRIA